jgi:LuxR family transcriptional regulator, maltose regulon positive regulatory protein
MTQLLLTTKLFFPRARTNLVSRPRLIERLSAGLRKPLTLISAPAGYGKTTLLSDWRFRFGSEYPLAWLSLDPGDNNLARFLTYVSAALETLDPELPRDLVSLLHLPQLPPAEELIAALINGVAAFPRDFALVLDDCHVITDPTIHATLAYLLDHLPPTMHLVMLTRADPPLHLAKLRARGDLVELRAADLGFTIEEASIFFNMVMDLHLSAENISALDQRTEGWAVGLQIAGLSLQNKADVGAFIHAFAGSNRHILDFLSEEVIQGQTEEVQTFLLHTSILDRLSGPLCDAVLGEMCNSAQILVELERKNLFLIPLDDERHWYRYHHLFSELLFQELKRTQPASENLLYERAANWFKENGYLEDAVGYTLKAGKYEDATRLMDQTRVKVLDRGDIRLWFHWLNILPENMIQKDPFLSFNFASYLTLAGFFELAEKWLRLAEDGFRPMVATNPHAALRVLGIPTYRSVHARYQGDYSRAIGLCQDTLGRIPEAEIRYIGVVQLFLGQAYFYAGDTHKAEQVLTDAIQTNLASGHLDAYINASHHLAQLRVLQGCLSEAREIYEKVALPVKHLAPPVLAGAEHACLGDLKREWNQLEAASVEIQKGLELAEAGDHIMYLTDVYLARVRLALSLKDWEAAHSYLQKAEGVAHRSPSSIEIALIQAWRARLNLAQGKLAEAIAWAESKEAQKVASLNPQHEFELLTLARIWLGQGKTDQAASLLETVRITAEEAGRSGRGLEAQMLQALVDQEAGDEKRAFENIIQVLDRAEPEGYMRTFIEEGTPMAKLLYKVSTQAATAICEYAARLLEAYNQEQAEQPPYQSAMRIEPLSKREIEVLRLLANGHSNKEIATQLVISLGTVKRHVIHIFQKLDAANRTQAVAIARELGIL